MSQVSIKVVLTVSDDCLLRLQLVTERVQITVRLNALAENYVLLLMSSCTNTTFLSFITPLHIGGSHTILSNCANKFRVIPAGKFGVISLEFSYCFTEKTVRLQSKNIHNENKVYLLCHSKLAEHPA
jgi:hypothetical protein